MANNVVYHHRSTNSRAKALKMELVDLKLQTIKFDL
jgi:hypothetical protein